MSNPFANLNAYNLVAGTINDRDRVLLFLETTYRELYPDQEDFSHLENTLDRYLSVDTPVWFVSYPTTESTNYIACLWIGIALDQITGIRHPNIFLVYVDPAHRLQGIGQALMQQAEIWARTENYTQIGLQVFTTNQPALHLYQKLNYQPYSISMMKMLE